MANPQLSALIPRVMKHAELEPHEIIEELDLSPTSPIVQEAVHEPRRRKALMARRLQRRERAGIGLKGQPFRSILGEPERFPPDGSDEAEQHKILGWARHECVLHATKGYRWSRVNE